jgi:hypothetical protein
MAVGAADVKALVEREPSLPDDKDDVVGWLQRLCRVAARDLHASGVGVSVFSDSSGPVSVAASGSRHALVEELQFMIGEGPCIDAFTLRRPVLTPDLTAAAGQWPGYAPAAQAYGVRSVFAFPLHVGAARLGAVDVYRATVGELAAATVVRALSFAEAALSALLDAQGHADSAADDAVDQDGEGRFGPAAAALDAQDGRREVYQAQGMVSIQLGVPIEEASARLRAHAFARDRRLSDVALDVVGRKLRFTPDHL